ncbi:MAG: XdhC family protein [Nitrospirales bacterium]
MANQLLHLLTQWHPNRDACEWVLGTVYNIEGPCYRKPGAMMLFNGRGEQFGMLSGGCLEADIQRHARQVMLTGKAITLCYDSSDEDDFYSQVSIGCGGTVHILLQPIIAQTQYLYLDSVFRTLSVRRTGLYYQRIPDTTCIAECRFIETDVLSPSNSSQRPDLIEEDGSVWLATPIVPEPHLLVVGGGLDAQSLVSMAHVLGWQVSVWDPRPANARREHFLSADWILQGPALELFDFAISKSVGAAVLMTHNIQLDGAALHALQQVPLQYMALLGPTNRRLQVLEYAGLRESNLTTSLAGPAGLDIGAELPESIALSILAECHASLKKRSACSLTGVLV